jgi:5,10-methylene-tetrahydrofolate dehydrogenase/methenyl tetrahydrofolate cyclohydrolase
VDGFHKHNFEELLKNRNPLHEPLILRGKLEILRLSEAERLLINFSSKSID